MHTGTYHVKLVLRCAGLYSHPGTHSNTGKPTHPYLLPSQCRSSKYMFLPLILQRGLGLVGYSDELSGNGGAEWGGGGVAAAVILP